MARRSHDARPDRRFDETEASIRSLEDNDLFDFADNLFGHPGTPLGEIAAAEMASCNVGL